MDFPVIFGISVGLAMDAFAVAIAGSVTLGRVSARQVFRFAFHFGLFQAMMPVLGWLAGSSFHNAIAAWDHWLAFGLLLFIGVRSIWESNHAENNNGERPDPTRGLRLVTYSVATSIDALAVGLSFAMLGVSVWYPSLVIGLVTAALTTVGMLAGARLGRRFGRRMEVLGGLILIGIGLKILFDHLR